MRLQKLRVAFVVFSIQRMCFIRAIGWSVGLYWKGKLLIHHRICWHTIPLLLLTCISIKFVHASKAAEKPIAVVIPSYNNIAWYKKNLDSVYKQHYSNYSVVYIDDCSPDNTGEEVMRYVKELKQDHRTRVIRNKKRVGGLANLYTAIHECQDDTIVVHLDGDDWFAHDNVLEKINKVYSEHDIWYTYGEIQPSNNIGSTMWVRAFPDEASRNNSFRRYGFRLGPLRTHYAWLFKLIKLKDLLHYGNFYSIAWDVAMLFPIVEMASRGHVRYITDILYTYNQENGISDFRGDGHLMQALINTFIRAQKPYKPLDTKKYSSTLGAHDKADTIIIADTPKNMVIEMAFAISKKSRSGEIFLLHANNWQQAYRFSKETKTFDETLLLDNQHSLASAIHGLITISNNKYVFLVDKTVNFSDSFDLNFGIGLVKKHHADVFLLAMTPALRNNFLPINLPPVLLDHTVSVWQALGALDATWTAPVIDAALWSKKSLAYKLEKAPLLRQAYDLRLYLHSSLYADRTMSLVWDNEQDSQQSECPDVFVIAAHQEVTDTSMRIMRERLKNIGNIILYNPTQQRVSIVTPHGNKFQIGSLVGDTGSAIASILRQYQTSDHILLTREVALPRNSIDCSWYVNIAQRAKIDTLFLSMRDGVRYVYAHNMLNIATIDPHIYLWKPQKMPMDYDTCVPMMDMTLWEKNNLIKALESSRTGSLETVQHRLYAHVLSRGTACGVYVDLKYDIVGCPEVFLLCKKHDSIDKIDQDIVRKLPRNCILHMLYCNDSIICKTWSYANGTIELISSREEQITLSKALETMLEQSSSKYIVVATPRALKKIPKKIHLYYLKLMQYTDSTTLLLCPTNITSTLSMSEVFPCMGNFSFCSVAPQDITAASPVHASIWYKYALLDTIKHTNFKTQHELDEILLHSLNTANRQVLCSR